ncbi:MAG TPA: pilus assembly protein TadG-related protein [Solirubrobacteraceae bacterium]|nr:pilus assembly protein TadG-related protein [Solirubrobacteraceae bacterium]
MSTQLSIAHEQRGAVLVFFALFAPVAVLFLSFVLDVGNWFDHARHLQTQADASALAAAQGFQPCNNEAIYKVAGQYGGAAKVTTPTGGSVTAPSPLYNQQLGGTTQANIHELINSPTYYNQSSPVDSTVNATNPCEAEMVDVKLTETHLPWYLRLLSLGAPNANAHARVEILQETSARGIEPLAVAETAPVAAEAYFVNEDKNNEVLASVSLERIYTNAQGQGVWSDSKAAPVAVAIKKTNATTAHIGVVIALSGKAGHTKCGEAYVQCFDEKTGPLLHIAGYSKEGTGTLKAPLARQVALTPITCSDGYFSSSTASCTFAISAKIDYGSTNTKGVTVTPEVTGTKGKEALAYNPSTGLWTGTATLAAGSGSNEVSLLVQCDNKAKESACATESKKTEATIANVHRIYAASWEGNSGTIAGAWVSQAGVPDANSFEVCETADGNSCTQELTVTVDVGGSLSVAAGYADPLRKLRFEGEQGVRAGCPPSVGQSGSKYREHLETGCPGTYAIDTKDPLCEVETEPYECLAIGLTGKDVGPTREGIDQRIVAAPPAGTKFYCENNWKNNNSGGVPIIPSDDSRVIQVFITPYGVVDAEGRSLLGNEEIPIQNFAAFYVTGFPGDPCASDPKTGNAEVVGHFIEYINPLGVGGEGKCVASSIGECVAVLTR